MNKDIDRIESWVPCTEGLVWAREQSSLEEVWDKCKEPSWLFFICKSEDELKLKKEQSVAIAIAFANRALDKFEAAYPDDKRPRKAIEAAQAWLDNPTKKNADAADAAGYAADDAARAALADTAHSAAHAAGAAAAAARSADAAAGYSAAHAAFAASYDRAAAAAHGTAYTAAYAASYDAAYAADTDAWDAYNAEQKAQADIIRLLVPNPFR